MRLGRAGDNNAACLVLPVALLPLLLSASTALAQVSPEEHLKHHPPPGQAPAQPGQAAGGGMMGDMGAMMEQMHGSPPKQLYPKLMSVPELTPALREEIERDARVRMREGTEALSRGLARLSAAASSDDLAGMRLATEQMGEGLVRFESGLAGRLALREGRPPRSIALGWFRREMALIPVPPRDGLSGPFGLSWFHAFSMALLIAFAGSMLWMYFHKMRRAAELLAGLSGGVARTPGRSDGAAASLAAPPPSLASTPLPEAGRSRFSGTLRVARIFEETPDVKTFRLMNPLGGVLPFRFLPGQFLTVAAPREGKRVRRSYTIASSPTQGDYAELTVKLEEGGIVSGYLHRQVKEGDLVEVSGPAGSFIFTGRECNCILLIGGGVGITPLMSVLRYLTDRSWPGDIYLIYGMHGPDDFIYREELEYLGRRHKNFRVVATASHPEGTAWHGETGRITKELIARTVPDLARRYVHLCGPVPLMESVRAALQELGVPGGRIKTEAFGPALGRPEPGPEAAGLAAAADATLPTVAFSLSGKSAPLAPDKVVLEVADRLGVEIDNSCRVGTCGLCRVRLVSGAVSMAVEEGLEPGDKEKGIVLACQAKSDGDLVVEA